jgi:hypothetical protein
MQAGKVSQTPEAVVVADLVILVVELTMPVQAAMAVVAL